MRGLIQSITIVGPYLHTPKIDHLNKVIAWLSAASSCVLEELLLEDSPLLSDVLVEGYKDADRSFDLQITEAKNGGGKNRVSVRFEIEQQMTDPKSGGKSYGSVLRHIADE